MNQRIWCLALVLSGAALVAVGAAADEADAAQPPSVSGSLSAASLSLAPTPGADLARPAVAVARVLSSAAGMSLLAPPAVALVSAKAVRVPDKGCGFTGAGCFCVAWETNGCDVQTACGGPKLCKPAV